MELLVNPSSGTNQLALYSFLPLITSLFFPSALYLHKSLKAVGEDNVYHAMTVAVACEPTIKGRVIYMHITPSYMI